MNQKTKYKENNILPPTLDVVFQVLFGEVGSERISSNFLEAILNTKISSIDLSKNPILRRQHIDDKLGVLDIVAKINDNEYCDIEMQCCSEENIVERLLFYWSGLYSKQIKSGNDYSVLNKTIGILISNFNVKGLEHLPYNTSWRIIEEKYRKTILTEKLELYIIELPKIANLKNEKNELLDWLFFLVNPKSKRVLKRMNENKNLKEAYKKLEQISQDEHMQRIAEFRQRAIIDENTARSTGFRKRHGSWKKRTALRLEGKSGIEAGMKKRFN